MVLGIPLNLTLLCSSLSTMDVDWINEKKLYPYISGKNSVHGTVCHDELYYDLKEAQYQNVSDGRQFYRPALTLLSLN